MTKQESYSDAMIVVSAGLHVTLSAIEIAIYHCAKFADIQERVYQELNIHYNKYKAFESKKMSELHIFRAFIYESLRYGCPVQITSERTVTGNDYKLGPYNVPKGATIFGNVYVMHRSPKYFAKPNDFYLEHFLDDNELFKKNKNLWIWEERLCGTIISN